MLGRRVSIGPAIVLVFAAAVLLGVAGCRNNASPKESPRSEGRAQDSSSPPPVGTEVVIGFGRRPSLHARSLRALVDVYETIVVAKVTTATDMTFADLASEPEPHPRAAQTVRARDHSQDPPTVTFYDAEVLRSIGRAPVAPGTIIQVSQAGGVKNGIAYQLEGAPAIRVGATYLFFVQRGPHSYAGPAFGRFEIDATGRFMPNGWETYAGVAAVSGLTIDEAAARVARAFTEPDVPLAAATATGTSTLTVTVTIPFATATPTPAPRFPTSPEPPPVTPTPTTTASPMPPYATPYPNGSPWSVAPPR